MSKTDKFFSEKYGYSIYKKTSSLSQLLQQAECDAIGIRYCPAQLQKTVCPYSGQTDFLFIQFLAAYFSGRNSSSMRRALP